MRPHRYGLVLAAALAAGATVAFAAPSSRAAAEDRHIVVLGDSYASGEAARFRGNNATDFRMRCSRHNTDLAYVPTAGFGCRYDLTKVYEKGTEQEGECHRSTEHAPIAVAGRLLGLKSKNFACSGASSPHIIDQPFKQQELSQSRLLAEWLKSRPEVEAVVLSVGGNDLRLSDVARECITGYVKPDATGAANRRNCHERQDWLDGNYKEVLDGSEVPSWGTHAGSARGVPAAIEAIRNVMRDAGYGDGTYALYLVGYPPPVPPSSEVIESNWAWRVKTGSCPLSTRDDDGHRDDFTWFNAFGKKVNTELRSIAAAQDVRFMDQGRALDGHLLCQQGTEHPEDAARAGAIHTSEWVRFVTYPVSPLLPSQGSKQEPLHPNHWGQAALGNCYAQMIRSQYTAASCINDKATDRQTLRNDGVSRRSAR